MFDFVPTWFWYGLLAPVGVVVAILWLLLCFGLIYKVWEFCETAYDEITDANEEHKRARIKQQKEEGR